MTGTKKLDTLEEVTQFFEFLQGGKLEGAHITPRPKLSLGKAFSIIYALQEVWGVIPDKFEMCDDCKVIFDSEEGGDYFENTSKHFCESCVDRHWQRCEVCDEPFDSNGGDATICPDCKKPKKKATVPLVGSGKTDRVKE